MGRDYKNYLSDDLLHLRYFSKAGFLLFILGGPLTFSRVADVVVVNTLQHTLPNLSHQPFRVSKTRPMRNIRLSDDLVLISNDAEMGSFKVLKRRLNHPSSVLA